MVLTRRDYLTTSVLASSGVALSAVRDSAEGAVHSFRAHLSLNENPFGPSQLALTAIREQFGELYRYVDKGAVDLPRFGGQVRVWDQSVRCSGIFPSCL
jgi:histidinol-phosphate/aromatic aminotransferase/cobyric acid decarboxylase-like protein